MHQMACMTGRLALTIRFFGGTHFLLGLSTEFVGILRGNPWSTVHRNQQQGGLSSIGVAIQWKTIAENNNIDMGYE